MHWRVVAKSGHRQAWEIETLLIHGRSKRRGGLMAGKRRGRDGAQSICPPHTARDIGRARLWGRWDNDQIAIEFGLRAQRARGACAPAFCVRGSARIGRWLRTGVPGAAEPALRSTGRGRGLCSTSFKFMAGATGSLLIGRQFGLAQVLPVQMSFGVAGVRGEMHSSAQNTVVAENTNATGASVSCAQQPLVQPTAAGPWRGPCSVKVCDHFAGAWAALPVRGGKP